MDSVFNLFATLSLKADEFNKGLDNAKQKFEGLTRYFDGVKTKLGDVNKALKLDPGNVELVAQKQRTLQSAIGETKNRLTELKGISKDSLSTEEWDRLQIEIVETENELKNLEQEYKQFGGSASAETIAFGEKAKAIGGKFKEVGEKVKEAGQKMVDVGNKLKPVSAAAIAGFTAAIKTTADFDGQMSKVAAISGATGKEFDALRSKAREMGSNTKFSATEAAQAFEYMGMAGWDSGQMIDGVSGIMNLAAASGENLATTSDIVTDALTAFGMSADESSRFADVLAATATSANTNVAMMGETFKYVAPVAGSLGYSVEDTAQSIGLMANAGIKSSQAGTSLRSIMTRLATDAGASSKSLGALGTLTEKLGVEFYNTDGTARDLNDVISESREAWKGLTDEEQQNYAKKIAGQNAISGWNALMNASEQDINKVSTAIEQSTGKFVKLKDGSIIPMSEALKDGKKWIEEYSGVSEAMAAKMQDNLGGQLTILKSQLMELAISVGDILMPRLREFVEFIQGVVDKFNSLDENQKKVIVDIGLLVAALAPVLIIGGNIAKGIGNIIILIGQIIEFIPMIISGVSGFTAFVTTSLIPTLATIGTVITGTIIPAITAFITAAASIVAPFLPFIAIAAAVVAAGVLIYKNWDTIKAKAKQFVDTVVKKFNELKEKVVQAVAGLLEPVIQKFQAIFDSIKQKWEAFMAVFKPLLDAFANLFTTIFQAVIILVGRAMETVKNKILQIWDNIKTAVGEKVEAVKNAIKEKFESIVQIIAPVMEKVLTAIINAWNKIQQKVGEVIEKIKTTIKTKFDEMVQVVSTPLQNLFNTIKNKFDSIKQSILGVVNKAKTWGRDLIKNFIAGIKEKINDLTKTINGVAKTIKNKVGFSEPKEGPLSDFHTYAPDMIDLFIQGIRDNSSKLNDAVNNAFDFSQATTPEMGAQLAFAGAGGQYIGNGKNIDTGAFSEAVVNALDDLTVIVNIGQERLEGVVNQVIQKRNYKSGGR